MTEDHDAQLLRDEIRYLRERLDELCRLEQDHHADHTAKIGYLRGSASQTSRSAESLERRIERLESMHMHKSHGLENHPDPSPEDTREPA
ncbi:MAG: hypothetical protein V1929_00190 [bacterium]